MMSNCEIEKKKRKRVPLLPIKKRTKGFPLVERRMEAREAVEEAKRCLAATDCHSCEVCSLLCPDLCITRDQVTGKIVIDFDYCKGCGICAFVCPKGAITMVLEE